MRYVLVLESLFVLPDAPSTFSRLLCALGGVLYEPQPLSTHAFWLPDGSSQWEDIRGWTGESSLPVTLQPGRDCTVLGDATASVWGTTYECGHVPVTASSFLLPAGTSPELLHHPISVSLNLACTFVNSPIVCSVTTPWSVSSISCWEPDGHWGQGCPCHRWGDLWTMSWRMSKVSPIAYSGGRVSQAEVRSLSGLGGLGVHCTSGD